ncbi:hypothetical protein RJ641_019805 [Dillenia turbinata]|uniref:RING-type E3 ubiquitin transferase n=1 Tax=Dillenia turbinata TaxID=194707 RepID=A0AAN8YZ04_9MAGN
MSSRDQAVAAILAQVALAGDGAVLGLALAYVAIRTLLKFTFTSSSLRTISKTPSLSISDLRSLLSSNDEQQQHSTESPKLVFVRGVVESKANVDGSWKSMRSGALVSHESGDKAVIIQRTQSCIYNEWKGLFWWSYDLRSLLPKDSKSQRSSSFRAVPFVLTESGRWPSSDYVIVNLGGSTHPLPLTTVYHQLQPVNATAYTFFQALFGHEYPVGVLDEEKILPLGKDISAVGLCSLKNGILEIKSCQDLPYFLSEMTKDQMLADLAFRTKLLLWGGIVFGSLSIGILGYAVLRNWSKWKECRLRRQARRASLAAENEAAAQLGAEEETETVPDGELCVICLMRRRCCAFIPCGHLVCCQSCAFSVEVERTPKCPVCRQPVRNSMRIYDS